MSIHAPHPSWQVQAQHCDTDAARQTRAERRALHSQQKPDPLAERQRRVQLWRECAAHNFAYAPYSGAWWHPFITQPGLMRFLLPGLRAHLQAKQDERRAATSRQHEQAPQPNQQELFA